MLSASLNKIFPSFFPFVELSRCELSCLVFFVSCIIYFLFIKYVLFLILKSTNGLITCLSHGSILVGGLLLLFFCHKNISPSDVTINFLKY